MIVTLTANTTMDQVMMIPAFVAGATLRATQTFHTIGGKPTDASYILGKHGIPSLALGFAGGAIGMRITQILQEAGATVDFVEVDGESRMAIVLATADDSLQTTITPNTLHVHAHHVEALFAQLERVLPRASCLVTGGTLPHGLTPAFYTRVVTLARAHGVAVVMDAKADNLRAGLAAGVSFIKPNREELEGLMERPLPTLEAVHHAGRELAHRFGVTAVITLGGEGALVVQAERAWHIPPIKIAVVSAVGAGDAVLAGVARVASGQMSLEDGLRFGVATATAVCLHPGTANFELDVMRAFLPQVQFLPYA